MAMRNGLMGVAAAAGVGVLQYKRGTSPYDERNALLRAVVAACDDAGLDPAEVDGFVSYGDDHNEPVRLMPDLGTKELRLSTAVWGGGGGGLLGAFELAAMAIATGQANAVVVYRALVQGDSGRLSSAVMAHFVNKHYAAAGMLAPALVCALRARRMIEQRGLPASTVEALVQADYYHASKNPEAVAYGQPLDLETYRNSRYIAEPLHLFDCSRENDGAGAVLLVSAERARDLKQKPVYLLAAATGAENGWGELNENDDDYTSTGFEPVARRLWGATGLSPRDIDVVQLYENFSYQGVSSLIGHGLTTWESAAEDLTFDNLIAPSDRLPVNTNGGNLAAGFIHGINVAVEAVRQLRGQSANPVPDTKTCLIAGGPSSPINSSAIFANELP
jgi:acetyl-CoA acetyltransferase